MSERSSSPAPSSAMGGAELGRCLLDLLAARSTAVVRVAQAAGPTSVHVRSGRVTRVTAEGRESLAVHLVRKGLLTAAGMRAGLAEVEHDELTFGEALESLGLMDRAALAEERTRRAAEVLESVVGEGGAVARVDEGPPRGGADVDPCHPVIAGLARSPAADEWLWQEPDLGLEVRPTPLLESLRDEVAAVLGAGVLPVEGDRAADLVSRAGEGGDRVLAALVVGGLVTLHIPRVESPEELETRAAGLTDLREATALLLEASAAFEARRDEAAARRTALGALRRSPTDAKALDRVEVLCLRAGEVAALELVYELVAGAMPGPFGRRSVLYRAGAVYEERLSDLPRAREYYRRAFDNVPESGAVLEALERTARAAGDGASMADAYAAVGMACSRPELREAWLRKAASAARLVAGEESAIELLLKLHGEEPSLETERILGELAPGLVTPTPPPGPAPDDAMTLGPLDDELEERAADDRQPPLPSPASGRRESWTTLGEAAAAAAEEAAGEAVGGAEPEPTGEGSAEPPDGASELDGGEPASFEDLEGLLREADEEAEAEAARDGGSRSPEAEPPTDGSSEQTERLRGLVEQDPGDVEAIRGLRAALEAAGDEAGEAAARAVIGAFDGSAAPPPLEPAERLSPEAVSLLAGRRLDDPHLRALGTLWRVAPGLHGKELADLGIGRALPFGSPTPPVVDEAFVGARRALGIGAVRLLHVPSGPAVRVVATPPPSILVGPGAGETPAAELRFRVARAAAMAMPELLLACALAPSDLAVSLRALQAAFGRSLARGSLDFLAASMAQNLWTALPAEAQGELRATLADASPADAEGVRNRAVAAASCLGLAATGDVGAAVRVAVADDPFLAGTSPTTEAGFARAARRSELVAALLRLALGRPFAEISWRLVPPSP